MTNTPKNLLDYIHVVVGAWRNDPRDDAQLLAQFAEVRDEGAFTALLWRHGQLVWRTCTRVLGDGPDTEDAFQATFVALARKARQLRGDTLAGWLHRVARQAALDTEAKSRKRRSFEHHLRTVTQQTSDEHASRAELYAALDEELAGLPERLRVPLVLRYLEGKTQDEVARILGCSRSVALRRLAKGEAILRERLERRGLAVGIGSVAVLLGSTATAPTLQARLIGSTVRMALRSLSFPLESSTSAALAEGVMKTMLVTKMKIVTVLLGVTLCLVGGGVLAYQSLAGNAMEPPQPIGETREEAEAFRQPGAAARVDCYGDPLPAGALARMGTTRLYYHHDNKSANRGSSTALAFSPDGKTLATHIDGMIVYLWDAATGKEIRQLTAKVEPGVWSTIVSLGFSLDGKTLIAMDGGQTVCRWEVATGMFLRKQEYQGPKRNGVLFLQVAFLPDGQMLGFGNFRKSVEKGEEVRGAYVWDVATGKEICQLSRPLKEGEGRHQTAISRDGKLLATVTDGGKIIHLWNIATGKEIRQLTYEDGGVNAVVFSRDGKTLASEDSGKICVWEVATGKRIHQFEAGAPSPELSSRLLLTFSPDGKTLLGGRIGQLWDAVTGKEIRSFSWDNAHVALFSPDGKILAMGDQVGSIRLWEVATGKEIGPRQGYRGCIRSVAYSPDGKTLASIGENEMVRLWEVATGKEIRPLVKHAGWEIGRISYSPDGKMLLSMDFNMLRLWDTTTGKEIRRFENRRGDGGFDWRSTFSPDGKKLAAVGWSYNKLICVWDVATGKRIYTLETHLEEGAKQVAIAFSPDGRLLAASGKDNTVSLWEVATGQPIGQLGRPKKRAAKGNALFVSSLAFSPDGRLLATSSSGEVEGKVRVWEVASGKEIWQLRALKPGFNHGCVLAFSPDGRILATEAPYRGNLGPDHIDPTVRLWEVASGKEIGQLTGHQGIIRTIAFSPDGKTLASGSDDLTCLVWDVTPFTGRLKPVLARPLAPRVLSKEQLEAAWTDLAKDPAKAYAVVRDLQAVPAQAIALLQARVRPVVPPADPGQLKRWIADLDAASFTVREKAQREIEKLGESALPALRQALKGQPSVEVRRRLKDLLAELEPQEVVVSPNRLRELRAVQVLESLGTAEARQVLQALTKGVAEAHLTQQAQAALVRLAKRSAARP